MRINHEGFEKTRFSNCRELAGSLYKVQLLPIEGNNCVHLCAIAGPVLDSKVLVLELHVALWRQFNP